MNAEMRTQVPNRLPRISRLADDIEAFARRGNISDAVVYRLNLVLDEILTNIISYGYEGQDEGEHMIDVVLLLDGGGLRVEVKDDAIAFDPLSEAPEAELDAEIEDRPIGGLGIHFLKTMMDQPRYRRENGQNILTFNVLLEERKEA